MITVEMALATMLISFLVGTGVWMLYRFMGTWYTPHSATDRSTWLNDAVRVARQEYLQEHDLKSLPVPPSKEVLEAITKSANTYLTMHRVSVSVTPKYVSLLLIEQAHKSPSMAEITRRALEPLSWR